MRWKIKRIGLAINTFSFWLISFSLSSYLYAQNTNMLTSPVSSKRVTNPYERLSAGIRNYISVYAFEPADFITRKMEYDVIQIFVQRFDKMKSIMQEILESKLFSETVRISSFFSDKMKPFAELEDMRRAELLTALQNYLKTFPDSPLTPYAILRYAELLYEKLSYEYIVNYEKAMLEGSPVPQKDFSSVIKIYEDFLKKYPNFPRRDAVLYLAGYVLEEMGESMEAVEKYFEPLAKIRISQFAPEAAMRAGEFWFNAGDLDRAEEFYMVVLDFPKHPLYSKALFKLAWTYYRKGDYELAIDYFSEAINMSGEEEKKTGVVQEAVDYLIASIVEIGGFNKVNKDLQDKAVSAVQRAYGLEPEGVMQMILETEGRTYFDQGKYQEAIISFKSVVDKFYTHPRSVISAFGIYDSLKKLGDIEGASDWIVKVSQRWGPKSQWAQLNPQEYAKNKDKIENQLLEVSRYFHAKGNLDKALESYMLFLDLFPSSEFSAEVQFLTAELYFSKNDYVNAYKYYKANVENTVVRQNKFLIDSAWNMVLSADKAIQAGIKEAPELLKEASFMYERLFPMDRRVPIALYKAAQVLGREGKSQDALAILEKLVERYPGSEVVADSMLEIIKVYLDMGELEKVFLFSLSARKRRDILKEQDIAYVNDLGSKALFKIAKRYEEQKNYKEAVSKYLELISLFPQSDLVDDCLYNIIMIKNEEKVYNDVVTLSKLFIDSFPKSDFLFDVIYVRAIALANLFYFEDAISTYKDIISRLEIKKKEKTLSDIDKDIYKSSIRALMNIHAGLGRFDEASQWVLKYYQEFGAEEQNPESYIILAADYYSNAGNYKRMVELLEEFINRTRQKTKRKYTPEIIQAIHRIARVYKMDLDKSKDKSALLKKYEELLSEIIKGGKEVPDKTLIVNAYSEALFYFAQKTFEEYKKIRFEKRDNKKQLQDKLKKKGDMAKKVEAEMMEIAKLRDPYWSFAALYYAGETYREFANMFIEAPIPAEIEAIRDPEEREMYIAVYREELEKQAFPLEDSALKLFSSSIERIKELGVRNEWTAAIFKALKAIDPLAPVEVEDDRTADLDIVVSMSSDKIPPIKEERKSMIAVAADQNINILNLVQFDPLKDYLTSVIVRDVFTPSFSYYSSDQRFQFINPNF
ncbi:MAG: tetratricopeptide repeat protein [Candidatus Calescibacterium sp.]|nr:tetratricopeptide repeat protein [Candidatus Calescibacterium sp.]